MYLSVGGCCVREKNKNRNMDLLILFLCVFYCILCIPQHRPQIKPDEGWGSRPIPGKDWGTSTLCEDAIVDELLERVEEACRLAGVRDSLGGLPIMPGGLDMEDDFDGVCLVDDEEDVFMSEQQQDEQRIFRKRKELSFAKRKRMSLWARASQEGGSLLSQYASLSSLNNNARRRRTTTTTMALSNRFDQGELPLLHEYKGSFPVRQSSSSCLAEVVDSSSEPVDEPDHDHQVVSDESILVPILSFLSESELLCTASLVCTSWAAAATTAHAGHMMASVGYISNDNCGDRDDDDDDEEDQDIADGSTTKHVSSMDRDWRYLTRLFPWACFLSSGAFKRVFRVYNSVMGAEEAVSVMDVDAIVDKKTIAAELVVSAMLSAIARRGICPNFVVLHGVFTLPYDVPESHWGCETRKRPKGAKFQVGKKLGRPPREPKETFPGRYQFMRMELCSEGDFEEYLKRQRAECLCPDIARTSLFQIAFALHAAADRCCLKHYDIKLLNVFVQQINHPTTREEESSNVVLKYGLGSHVFSLRMTAENAFFAKLADYGTANIQAESTGLPVTIAQFTTLENTPPDYMILGDAAKQGHGHDNFGLGLCMLHLFTGHAPYEEILEDVTCPPMLKRKLRNIWENESVAEYSVVRSVILSDVYKDERGHIVEGEPDETLYDTLYRFLVLFGVPQDKFEQRKCPAVWKAISEALEGTRSGGRARSRQGTDVTQYERDRQKYSLLSGTNAYIARARQSLDAMSGGMELLFELCSFNPETRTTALQVLNSNFMKPLRGEGGEDDATNGTEDNDDVVLSYTAFATCTHSSVR